VSRELEARLRSPGEWGTYGNHREHMRYVVACKNRRKCHCASHPVASCTCVDGCGTDAVTERDKIML
jgi:hypothetical protein